MAAQYIEKELTRIKEMQPKAEGQKFSPAVHLTLFERELLRVLWEIRGELDSISYCMRKRG